ncbi:hypothetical protein M2171_004375 [Bradyrhizobium japonicum USDA 38]|nr:hypothetical protein [Bradyrhizobium japonicum USDA 38]MCS3947757.1 hypothetical protein [Bradyrhizobium japonicum]MCW2219412.1 hypothetical protein [Bradyrhizobium japonicum]MCW2344026.1 hypothetical protein [Bradyrhizobium japonicum]
MAAEGHISEWLDHMCYTADCHLGGVFFKLTRGAKLAVNFASAAS